MKFGRIYSMQAQGVSGTIHAINFPLTCRFRVGNAALPYAEISTFQIYNLSPDIRHDLQKDYFQQDKYRSFSFAAGYQTELPIPVIIQGNIQFAYSYRRGPDWITEITAFSGGFAQQTSQTPPNFSIPSPYHFDDVLTRLVQSMEPQHVGLGVIGNFVVPNSRGIVFCGNTWDLLVNAIIPLEAQITINKELVYILNQNEIIEAEGTIDTIDADTGLLESPRHQDNMLICKMIFEPRIDLWQGIKVDSLEPGNSGFWKVQRVDHAGTISGAVAESLNTEVTLFKTAEELVVAA